MAGLRKGRRENEENKEEMRRDIHGKHEEESENED